MDRLNQLRGEPGGSRDSTLDTTSPPSEAFLSAHENSSKYFSLSDVDSTFDITPIKDVSLNSTADSTERAISDLSPINKKNDLLDSYKIGKLSEAANILSGGVDIFDDNDNSYDGDELVIDDNVPIEPEEKANTEVKSKEAEAIPSKDTEVVLQIQGKSVEAIDIGNGLYLYRKEGEQEELAAVQVMDPEQQPPNYKFLKVRENDEGNLEVYEEIEVVIPKNMPSMEGKPSGKNHSHVPIKNINQVIGDSSSSKAVESTNLTPKEATPQTTSTDTKKPLANLPKEETDGFNGKMKFNETRKSPVISTYTPMTYHSTPNKEGIPLTKTMVEMQLHPGRHSDNTKKMIEVNTETCKKSVETTTKTDLPIEGIDVSKFGKESSDTLLKLDDKVPAGEFSKTNSVTAPKDKQGVVTCNAVESNKTELNKDLSKCHSLEKESENPSVNLLTIDRCEPLEAEKVDSSEISSTTTEIVNVDEKSGEIKNEAKASTEDKKTEIFESKLEAKIATTAIAKLQVNITHSSEIEVTPPEIKESKMSLKSRPDENKIETLDQPMVVEKESKNIEEGHLENKPTYQEVSATHCKAQVMEDKKATITEDRVEEKTTLEKNNKIFEAMPTDIKDANLLLLTQKQGPSSALSCNKPHEEVNLIEAVKVSAPSVSTVPLPNKDVKAFEPIAQVVGEPKRSEITHSLVEPKQNVTPEIKSSIARTCLPLAENLKTELVKSSTTEKDIKTHAEPKGQYKESSKSDKNSSNDLIQLNDLEVDLITQRKERENLEKSLEIDIGRLDQQLKTAQAKEEVIKPEINKSATTENVKSSETILSAKVKPNDLIVKAETKPIIATEFNQNKPLDNSEFVNKQVNKALLIRSPTNVTEPNKTNEVSKFTLESCNMPQRPDMAKKDIPKVAVQVESKPKSINNNAPCNVPFGKWTEANKQEYLNKIRETKVTTNTTTQLKQANDLNRRDVLKKIESQRQSNSIAAANAAKNHEIKLNHNKPCIKNETTVFNSKPTVIDAHAKNPLKSEVINKPDSTRLTIGPNLIITPVLRPVAPAIATSSLLAFGKKEVSPAYVPKTEFAAPNTANIAKRETPLQYPFNMTKKDVSRNTNATKRETATTSSANIITAPNVSFLAKKETAMPRATNLSKKDQIYSNTNIAKVETVTPSNVAKKEIVTNRNTKVPTKDAVPSGMNFLKKEVLVSAQNNTKKETTYCGANVTKKETDNVDSKKDSTRPTNQDLIDKTIEDYLLMERRPMNMSREAKEAQKNKERPEKVTSSRQKDHSSKSKKVSPLDDIEMQMNELHGIPFIERPPHELPHRYSSEAKTYSKNESRPKVLPMSKVNKLPDLMPLSKTQDSKLKANDVEELSEEEIIEHEPITGDIEMTKKDSPKNNLPVPQTATQSTSPKKDNVITENDFDKFVRRNSITYENCITVNYDVNKQHNIVQSVVGKDLPTADIIPAMPQHQNKGISNSSRFVPIQADDGYNANYHSKLQIAYQSALTAKQKNSPITVLEDKPVKVVFVDNNAEFVPSLLNVQGKELSPAKRTREPEVMTLYSCDSMDSDVLDTAGGSKPQDGAKKHKHQRKQVLTPVEAPEPELIEPKDLSLEGSPKKKRKTEDSKSFSDKNYSKSVSKKNYILARSTPTIDDKGTSLTESQRSNNITLAIDSLVKAAELLENQSEKSNQTIDSQTSQPTPVKRGRGRPRKYPLPDGNVEKSPKVPTPQKKPRLEKTYDTSSEGSSDDEMVRENWTMGKINEDIVCPICKKLFRSENVVFKHVKHCTGPSPNRSDSGKRSRDRRSQESDSKYRDDSLDSMDLDMESQTTNKTSVSREDANDELIQSAPVKSRRISEKRDHVPTKGNETRKSLQKAKAAHKTNNLVCEFCGKTFRQLSYLVSHRIQHNNDECSSNKDASEKESACSNKLAPNVFSCEVCRKEFRKLHHLVQHRIIHNPPNMPSKPRRKSSADNSEKVASNSDSYKITEDQSAGFRCEPCDKSFRKLHHLVEHRETHDGINRQKNTGVAQNNEKEKSVPPPPQCDVCKKTFRKLHHLIEHKEQHADMNSEKSDDKSVKSALSTKDIIHECSLCYMVFPNEHSLTKHTVICQRKKKQSKQSKPENEDQLSQDSTESVEEKSSEDATSKVEEEAKASEIPELEKVEKSETAQVTSPKKTEVEVKKVEVVEPENKEPVKEKKPDLVVKDVEVNPEMPKANEETIPKAKPEVAKVTESFTKPKSVVIDTIVIEDTPKKEKKPPQKGKIGSTVTKRQKTTIAPLPMLDENKPMSDEDEIRYMFNPNFKFDENAEEKNFMKVRGLKRNSLQIERPKSNLIKRRTSLQHPPRVARLKPKVEPAILPKLEPAPSTDSDDSDVVKYSFPPPNTGTNESKPEPKVSEKKVRRKSIAERRKSLGGIAKRKSLGKGINKPMKVLQEKVAAKKRLPEAGHRCDCGQLFSSAALLSRHTTLAHTPPRIRRRRSPPPPRELKRPAATHKLTKESRKSSFKSEAGASKPNTVSKKVTRKSTADPPSRKSRVSSAVKTPKKETKVKGSASKTSTVSKSTAGVKLRRSAAHSGVPVPEKMRKLMEKLKK